LRDAAEVVHGTCVALGGRGALLRGPSGCGKSDLALRFLFLPRRGPAAAEAPALVADDCVELRRHGSRVLASAPGSIHGKIEVRGVGIVEIEALPSCELVLAVDLVAPDAVERMPEPATARLAGIDLPLLQLAPFESSAPIKLALQLTLAVAHAGRS
jgi:serine kinase of HPr protein (carbohydrate metabolism regulator)